MQIRAYSKPIRCRRKFLRYFPDGFHDETYFDWERGYKETAYVRWSEELDRAEFRRLLLAGDLRDLPPRDMIDIQSFLWIQGSDEYP